MRQVAYTIFITSNHALLYLWRTENLVKYQKFSKYYVHGCLQNFLLLLISLIKALIVKDTHILAAIYFTFQKKYPGPNLKVFQ